MSWINEDKVGTDIWAYIESKDLNGNHTVADVSLDRDYRMFSLLAGVGAKCNPIYPPRGLPDDANVTIIEIYQGLGEFAHTASWLSTNELEDVFHAYNDSTEGLSIPTVYDSTLKTMRHLGEDTRLIFWFDN